MKNLWGEFGFAEKIIISVSIIIRLLMMLCIEPYAQTQWFVPFLSNFLYLPSLDPWDVALADFNSASFPYGIAMFLTLLPTTFLASIIGGINPFTVGMGIKITLLIFECICFALIILHLGKIKKYALSAVVLFWLSPLLMGATYWAGQLDIIPITFLFASFYSISKQRFKSAGVLLACSISAKMSMALSLPFVLIYFLRNTRMQAYAKSFLNPFFVVLLLLVGVPLLSDNYINMVLGTKEMLRILDMSFSIGGARIYLTPILLSIILYCAWSLPYLSYSLLTAFITLATLVLILTTQTPPGWFIWLMPFLLLHLIPSGILQKMLTLLFFCVVGIYQVLFWDAPTNLNISPLPFNHSNIIFSLNLTVNIALGLIIINGILRNSFYRNEIFRFGRKPISVGIAGDSSTGKDTLASSLINLFGKSSCSHISGDDYHSWDRKGALWKIMTHLNPRANNIKQFYNDINNILDKKSITYRHYQHSNGCFSIPIKMESKNFCIISGLHTLLQKALCTRYDVKIFLEMDESLRAYLKCRRDKEERNHTIESIVESMQKRLVDSKKYITPQQKNADIVFHISPTTDYDLTDVNAPMPTLLLTAKLRHSLYHEELVRFLIASCGLYVNVLLKPGMDEVVLEIEGNISAEDVSFFVAQFLPDMSDLLAIEPCWESGVQGAMQMIILCQLMQNLKVSR